MRRLFKRKRKRIVKGKDQTLYVVNPTEVIIEMGGKVFEPGDSESIPVELEKEARLKGLV